MSRHDMAPFSVTKDNKRAKAGKMDLHAETSDHARSILGGSQAGDTGDRNGVNALSRNRNGGGKVGPSKGGARYAGNINTRG